MKGLLAIGCIVVFSCMAYGLAMASTMNKFHKHNCRTIYIPEDMDLETAFASIKDITEDGLKRRAVELGATDEFIKISDKRDIQLFIIQHSVSDEHIVFEELGKELTKNELIQKRDHCRKLAREGGIDSACPTTPNPTLQEFIYVSLPEPTNVKEKEHALLQDPSISIKEMKQDVDDYMNNKK